MKRWFPYLTVTVFALTAIPSLIGILDPSVELALRRDPALIAQGEWYRLVTSLVTQDGGWFGFISNVGFLLVLGILAERRLGRWRWLVLYLGAAAVGQAAGCWFGTVGAGNSIANLGLAGGLVAACARHRAWRLDAAVSNLFIVLISVSGLGDDTARTIGFGVAVGVGGLMIAGRGLVPRWAYLVIAVLLGGWLTTVSNMHGPALLTGLLLGALITSAVTLEPEPTSDRRGPGTR